MVHQVVRDKTKACSAQTGPIDSDNDGIDDNLDNCPNMANSDQADNDNDGLGNVCDATPNGGSTDSDSDGIADSLDNCPNMANSDQADNDSDGLGNVCDATPNGDYSCTEYTSSNYSHVMAGRAVNYYGYAIAVGSGDNLGYYNIYVTSTVAEISNGHFEKGSCSSY
ncbi:thrombospondin type 3 repeat-containing protein [Psychrosphaera algicola]|uniref:Thrombospondin type 3 repeat-containing protein n=1 Tax=Psychrosphaera algicola TaxID=3023714 RepID=A0ABT5FIZ5_9GAMM|nr:thrombospondin type 3 repeat-containing protein [Psychrosphaera sp. G1-22]MDC2891168.1 thrombospondin type 3 repeat-containing protein [Psychrosphaera sp. G1-22]